MRPEIKAAIEAWALDLGRIKATFGVEFPEICEPSVPPGEADRCVRGLNRVSDICAVDTGRLMALQKEILRLAASRRGSFDLFHRKNGL
ncbi:hypothetical protein [Antarctobacter heliothermus]|uniref:Uncharacterized protein n=1 Tax=Antarctobacter heliothermus TaxID=74033 RepID=A0A239JMS5_9RHOB|nr:hypothetical protein [Antarctobacter heliothermus]SNT07100.1 hypothetical protein SAMN04488078_105424 [Antarctobacter heliothermus]